MWDYLGKIRQAGSRVTTTASCQVVENALLNCKTSESTPSIMKNGESWSGETSTLSAERFDRGPIITTVIAVLNQATEHEHLLAN